MAEQFPQWLKRRWRSIGLGCVSCSGVLVLAQADTRLEQIEPSSPVIAPIVSEQAVRPSPRVRDTPSVAASPSKRSTTGKLAVQSPAEPVLTQAQQAAQQQAIAELEASIPTVDSLIEMQVAIEVDIASLAVSVSAPALLLDEAGNTLDTLEPGQSYTAAVDGGGLSFDGSALPNLVWIEPPVGSLFYLGDRAYRGRLLLAVENNRLWVVNFVSMRNYLYSVVASEVSASWNAEALKAQAVAARSYALTYYFNPVNSLYHLGDDEYFQVYSGTAPEDDRIRQAVDATAGEFVSYRGGVVESLYAASDDIVKEAFQGQGMSQLGALNLADQGYLYEQILSNYYPETSVGRIAQDF
jgi:stage II sporulation protein D